MAVAPLRGGELVSETGIDMAPGVTHLPVLTADASGVPRCTNRKIHLWREPRANDKPG